jgi:hypothetical protein
LESCAGREVYLGVDLFEDEVVSGFNGATEVMVEEADEESGDGEQSDQPAVGLAGIGGPVE